MVYRTSLTGPIFGLRREIDRLFEDTFGRDAARVSGWTPAVDVREDDKEIALEVELPGIKPSDVEITAENGVLTVRGEKQSTTREENEGHYHVVERSYGSFSRSFQLPQGVDETRIEAEFLDGLLIVHVPKAALPQPRRIEIRSSGSRPVVQGAGPRSSAPAGGQESLGAGRGETGRGSVDATSSQESGRSTANAGQDATARGNSRSSR